jgi:hypothetical protein
MSSLLRLKMQVKYVNKIHDEAGHVIREEAALSADGESALLLITISKPADLGSLLTGQSVFVDVDVSA